MPQQNSQSTGFQSNAFLWFVIMLRSLAVPLAVVLHRRMGERYWDVRTGVAALLIWFLPMWCPASDPRPCRGFLVLFLALCVYRRLESWWMARRGYAGHSRYSGEPLWCVWRPNWNELTVKRFLEPGAVILGGWAVTHWFNVPLGALFICSGLSALFENAGEHAGVRQRELDLRDAMLDAQVTSGMDR